MSKRSHRHRSLSRAAREQPSAPAARIGTQVGAPPQHWAQFLQYGLIGYLALAPFLRGDSLNRISPYQTAQFFALCLVVPILGMVWLYGWWNGWIRLPRSRWLWLVGFWLLVGLIATVNSLMPYRSIWGAYSVWSDGFLFQCLVAFLGLIALTIPWSRLSLRILGFALTGQVLILAGLSFRQLPNVAALLPGRERPMGFFGNSDYWFSYLLYLWFIPYGLAVLAFRAKRRLFGWLGILGGLILILNLFITLPQDLQCLAIRPFGETLAQQCVPTTAVTADPVNEQGEVAVATFLKNSSNSERFTQWRMGWAIGREFWLTGAGPGTVSSLTQRTTEKLGIGGSEWDATVLMEHPHNATIEEFATRGALGAVSYLALWIGVFALLFLKRRQVHSDVRPLWWPLYAGVLVAWVFDQFLFTVVSTGILRWAVVGILFSLTQTSDRTDVRGWWERAAATTWLRRSLQGGIVCVLLIVMYGGVRNLTADRNAARGEALVTAGANAEALVPFLTAADRVPGEDTYQWLAGRQAYRVFFNPPQRQLLVEENQEQLPAIARAYSARAVARNPYLPVYRVDYGFSLYVFSEAKSDSEREGEREMARAIAQSPSHMHLYATAGDAYVLKRDYAKAEEMVTTAYELYKSPYRKSRLEAVRALRQQAGQ